MATTLETLAAHVGGTLTATTTTMPITGAATLELAGPADITLLDAVEKLHLLAKSQAGAVIVPPGAGPIDRPAIEATVRVDPVEVQKRLLASGSAPKPEELFP